LERIGFDGNSNDINNWHSAAEAVGFATPGTKNSQYYPALETGDFSFTSETISPDSDGYEDILQVYYEMSEPGLLGTFTIYDDRGRKITELFANELLATSGSFKWDGVTEENTKASIGTYVAVFEAFNINGGLIFTKRKTFVVAGKL
jgi:flagellar hook assembly protein FlgD